MKSPFIENSKHAEMTSAVTGHFFGSVDPNTRGMPKGGTADWNGQPMGFPQGSGVNYVPRSQAGHTTTGSPLNGNADGLPGSNKALW